MTKMDIGQNCPNVKGEDLALQNPTQACAKTGEQDWPLGLNRLVDDRFLLETHDLVLDLQFTSLQFCNLKVIGGGVGEGFADFLLERLVPFLKFRKMRFNRHVGYLLASDRYLMGSSCTRTTVHKDTPFWPLRKSPLCTISQSRPAPLWGINQNAIIQSDLPA
jgi:hypothetical protein